MANKKIRLSKPSKASSGLNFKVRFKYESNGGHFIVTNKKRKALGGEKFNSHDKALEYAMKLQNETING